MPISNLIAGPRAGKDVRALSVALVLALFAPGALSQCGQLIKMKSYEVCVPSGWATSERGDGDMLAACETSKPCPPFFGAAPKGITFLFVRPAEGLYGHPTYEGAREVVEARPHAGLPAPAVPEVDLGPGPSGAKRQCFMARRQLSWAGAWEEHYGLKVGDRLFSLSTRYEDRPDRIQEYRTAIMGILSSITPK